MVPSKCNVTQTTMQGGATRNFHIIFPQLSTRESHAVTNLINPTQRVPAPLILREAARHYSEGAKHGGRGASCRPRVFTIPFHQIQLYKTRLCICVQIENKTLKYMR